METAQEGRSWSEGRGGLGQDFYLFGFFPFIVLHAVEEG
jgi:hypothetical protein